MFNIDYIEYLNAIKDGMYEREDEIEEDLESMIDLNEI